MIVRKFHVFNDKGIILPVCRCYFARLIFVEIYKKKLFKVNKCTEDSVPYFWFEITGFDYFISGKKCLYISISIDLTFNISNYSHIILKFGYFGSRAQMGGQWLLISVRGYGLDTSSTEYCPIECCCKHGNEKYCFPGCDCIFRWTGNNFSQPAEFVFGIENTIQKYTAPYHRTE
jgi:hypothetical protein